MASASSSASTDLYYFACAVVKSSAILIQRNKKMKQRATMIELKGLGAVEKFSAANVNQVSSKSQKTMEKKKKKWKN